jgi:hypothetical protein
LQLIWVRNASAPADGKVEHGRGPTPTLDISEALSQYQMVAFKGEKLDA